MRSVILEGVDHYGGSKISGALLAACVNPISSPNANPSKAGWKRSLISVALVAHLFCAFFGLFVGFLPSPLGLRFLQRMGPYTQQLCLDPRFSHPQLTVGTTEPNRDFSSDLVFEIHLPNSELELPIAGTGQWTGTNRRYGQLALAIAKAANEETENEATAASLAKGIALEAMDKVKSDRATIELIRWNTQPNLLEPNEPEDPNSPAYREVLYTVDVIRKADGKVIVSKRSAPKQAAPPNFRGALANPSTGGKP